MIMTAEVLEKFCTPPIPAKTEFDQKVLADARIDTIGFEGHNLHCYSWGEGKTVLLVHGWGSKASHLALLARHLARTGLRAVVIDGPSHGLSLKNEEKQQSSMFEFGRALSTVSAAIGSLYALVGHSFGALTAFFTSAGYGKLAPYQVRPERLVLISSPLSIQYVIEVYCRQEHMAAEQEQELKAELERGFDFSIEDYSALQALSGIRSKLLIVHDEEDEDVPFSNAVILHRSKAGSQLVATNGGGHQRILANRVMLRAVQGFLHE